jgi:hypothetical protein
LQIHLANDSRIVSLPGRSDETIVGYSAVDLLVVDEAARVPDAIYTAIRPMLATSRGILVCLSSAYAMLGFFFQEWTHGSGRWLRTKVMATECDRIDPAFLAEEREALGERLYRREYECVFSSSDDALFDPVAIERSLAAVATGPPLF